jgi:ubiquinone/menaquinone biosynthesis C-methylase UbiE
LTVTDERSNDVAASAQTPGAQASSAAGRIHHSAISVAVLGWLAGSSLGLAVAAALHYGGHLNPLAAYAIGTAANLLFHHFYYRVVYVNGEVRMRTPLPLQLLLYALVAGVSMLPLWLLLNVAGFGFLAAIVCTTAALSAANALLVRISTFSSAQLAEVEYAAVEEDFYDEQTDAKRVGAFRAWYHSSRHERLTDFVHEHYRAGMAMADLGCGNCRWNVHHLPVVGVDINEKMLSWAKRNSLLADYRVCPGLVGSDLPDKHFDLVVCSETLEHLLNYRPVLAEIRRVLKDDGTFLVTVPYDIFLGPFFLLFNVNCVYQGYVKKSTYHKYRCGHINHFTKRRLRRVLEEAGFKLDKLFVVNGLLLYGSVRKASL